MDIETISKIVSLLSFGRIISNKNKAYKLIYNFNNRKWKIIKK